MLADARDYAIAKRFGVQPWEAGEIPEYWVFRAQLFEKVFDQVQKHKGREKSE